MNSQKVANPTHHKHALAWSEQHQELLYVLLGTQAWPTLAAVDAWYKFLHTTSRVECPKNRADYDEDVDNCSFNLFIA